MNTPGGNLDAMPLGGGAPNGHPQLSAQQILFLRQQQFAQQQQFAHQQQQQQQRQSGQQGPTSPFPQAAGLNFAQISRIPAQQLHHHHQLQQQQQQAQQQQAHQQARQAQSLQQQQQQQQQPQTPQQQQSQQSQQQQQQSTPVQAANLGGLNDILKKHNDQFRDTEQLVHILRLNNFSDDMIRELVKLSKLQNMQRNNSNSASEEEQNANLLQESLSLLHIEHSKKQQQFNSPAAQSQPQHQQPSPQPHLRNTGYPSSGLSLLSMLQSNANPAAQGGQDLSHFGPPGSFNNAETMLRSHHSSGLSSMSGMSVANGQNINPGATNYPSLLMSYGSSGFGQAPATDQRALKLPPWPAGEEKTLAGGLSDMSDASRDWQLASAAGTEGNMNMLMAGFDLRKRKMEASTPGDEKKLRRDMSDVLRILEHPVMESSMEEIISAMAAIDHGPSLPASSNITSLAAVVRDRQRRIDRFHKKKSLVHPLKNPLVKSLKKGFGGPGNSSGQGCTIVVVNRKCQRHARGTCNPHIGHDPKDLIETREPVTRSNFGKWVNSYLKSSGIMT